MRYVTDAIGNPKVKRAIELAIGPLLLFALWWVAFKGQLVNKDLLPSPVDTLRDTALSIAAGKMTGDFLHTMVRVGYAILIAVVAAGVATLGVRILRQQQAQAAADAAALAGVESGQSAASEMAARNGAVLTSFRSSADGMTVTVAVMLEGESASARATRAP